MEKIRTSSIQWAIGVFAALLGAMMLVAPHHFLGPGYPLLSPDLFVWGLLFLTAGFALLSISILIPPYLVTVTVHLLSGGFMLWLAYGFWQAGQLIDTIQYTALAAGLVLALPRLKNRLSPYNSPNRLDLLSILLALSALCSGIILLSENENPNAVLPGALFLAGGAVLAVWQVISFIAPGKQNSLLELPELNLAIHMFASLAYFAGFFWLAIPHQDWPGIAYFATFGTALFSLPWLKRWIPASTPTTLRTRVALILTVSTCVPLILTVALISGEVERSVRADTLVRQQDEATALGQTVEDYISLHRAALQALARQPGLISLSREDQAQLINVYALAYPDTSRFSLFDASGIPILRSDAVFSPDTIAGTQIFQQARSTGQGTLDIVQLPVLDIPVLVFGEPVYGPGDEFMGLVTFSLSSDRLEDFLYHQASSQTGRIYLVDHSGRVITHSNPGTVAEYTDLSSLPPVKNLLYSPNSSGSVMYQDGQDTFLSGYTRLEGLNWGVISERTTTTALAGVRAGRDMAFGILLLFLLLTTAAGILLARAFSHPLISLAKAAREMAAANPLAPIPTSRIVEIQHLVDNFHEMRMRLAAQTTELRSAKQDLEARVEERTEELKNANELLHEELAVRRQAEAALRESQARLLLTTDAVEIGFWEIDLTGEILTTSERANVLLGLPSNAQVGYQGLLECVHQEDRAMVRERITETIRRQERSEVEFRLNRTRPGGRPGWLMNLGRAIYDETGQPVRFMGALFDITSRKAAEETLRQVETRQELQRYLTQFREGERLRVAQDLHDGPLQDLIALNLTLSDGIEQARGTPLAGFMSDMRETLHAQIRDLRAFCNELRPPALTPFGLEKAIRSYTDTFQGKHPQLNFSLDLASDGRLLSEPVRLAFFQIFKETLNNIAKHAQATDIFVRLCLNDNSTVLEIEDNGIGFSVPGDWLELARQGHLGLVGARERAEAVGGELWVQSISGEGTLVRVIVPRELPVREAVQSMVDAGEESKQA